MKLWLDAHREPSHHWVWATTAALAVRLLEGGCVERISVAHDQPQLADPVLAWLADRNSPLRPSRHRKPGRTPLGLVRPLRIAAAPHEEPSR